MFNSSGRVVGRIEGDTLHKRARAGKHMLRRPPSWAWDEAIIEQAERAGCRFTEILDLDSGTRYRASLADFRRHAVSLDRGFGRQLALPLGRWQRIKPGQSAVRQLTLFGEA